MELLIRNFNVDTADKVMCLDYLSVSWDGVLYDCDFNQQLDMPVLHGRPLPSQSGTYLCFNISLYTVFFCFLYFLELK